MIGRPPTRIGAIHKELIGVDLPFDKTFVILRVPAGAFRVDAHQCRGDGNQGFFWSSS
jgi:hypothetical protein